MKKNNFSSTLWNTALCFAFSTSVALPARAADPVVQVTGGQIRGREMPGGGAAFKGVPFAQPPVGDLRWRDPAPVKPWPGVRDAAEFAPPCTQQIARANTFLDAKRTEMSQEDCLYLNVWTAEWPSKAPKPVMVWLYTGGNTAGTTSAEYSDGAALSRRGVVLVSVAYRLGVLGFLVHHGLTAESPHHTSGNYGLLDQVAALKWVHDNIAKFGGDPGNVTVFGQSAGGIDTGFLAAASHMTKGLMHRAIQESGSPAHPIYTLAQEEQAGVKFAASLKAPPAAADAVKFLRAMSGRDVLNAANAARVGTSLQWPIIDGYLLPKYPALLYRDGNDLPIPIVTGNTALEENRRYDVEGMRRAVALNYQSLAPQALEFYGLANGGTGHDDPFWGPTGIQISTDTKHRCGAVMESLWRSAHGRTTYEYQFDVPVAGDHFTKHTAEIPFVFGNLLPKEFALGGPYTDADRKVSNDIQTYWVNFAKTGNPNGNGLPEWPKFNPETRPYLEFTIHDGPVVNQNLRRKICDLYIEGLKETIPANTAAAQ
jgi:para-nitrobenzyl esterase